MTPGSAKVPPSPGNQHMRQASGRSVQSSPKSVQIGTPQSALGRSAFSMSPPPVPSASPRLQRVHHTSSGRRLPPRQITRESIGAAFAAFILYANPSIPASTDTSELHKVFKAPPKSEGKTFDVFKLWELIRRLDNGELKTWVQLALELGVEPPSTSNGQSAQKIQQYVVRLKRWMHAMHIDAFFEYCLGKPHVYYMQVPMGGVDDVYEARDGVPPQEDLALRALLPGWKPKRGRRKASERDDKDVEEQRPPKRLQVEISPAMLEYQGLESGSMFPQGAMTWSAFPDDPESQGPWDNTNLVIPPSTSAQSNNDMERNITEHRWHRDLSPSGYPQSAIEQSYTIDDELDIPEPRSAIAPNSSAKTGKSRRRHGTTVSSAWTINGGHSTGKVRGRPPNTRPLLNGLQHPASEDHTAVAPDVGRMQAPPMQKPPSRPPSVATSVNSMQIHAPTPHSGRPRKLQLQVPQYIGAPVRLATPPTVTLNSTSELAQGVRSGRVSADLFRNSDAGETAEAVLQEESLLDLTIDDVVHTFASRILHGRLMGRQGSLSLEEATLIANKVIIQLRNGWAADLPEDSFAVRCATALGVSADLEVGSGAASIITVKSMPQPLHNPPRGRSRSIANADARNGVEYVLSFDIVYGNGISSSVQIHNIYVPLHLNSESFEREIESLRAVMTSSEGDIERHAQNHNPPQDEGSWKDKVAELQRELDRKNQQLRRMKRRVFEVVMADAQ